jgi:hypothetical protein
MLELIAPAWLPPAGVASMFVISTAISVMLAVTVGTVINRNRFREPLSTSEVAEHALGRNT